MSLEISASESGDKYVNKFMFAGKMSLTDCCVCDRVNKDGASGGAHVFILLYK